MWESKVTLMQILLILCAREKLDSTVLVSFKQIVTVFLHIFYTNNDFGATKTLHYILQPIQPNVGFLHIKGKKV